MWRLIGIGLVLMALQPVRAAELPVTFTFGASSGRVTLTAAGRMDSERIWFVANAFGATDLPYSGAPCPAMQGAQSINCTIWGVIDVVSGSLVSLHGQRDLGVTRARMVGDRLLLTGYPNAPDLPQSSGGALPTPAADGGYLLTASPTDAAEFQTYLPKEFFVSDVVEVEGDVILIGTAPCPECVLVSVLDREVRLMRLDADLSALRYDRNVPGRWSASAHVIDSVGRIHFAASGSALPTTTQSPIAARPDFPGFDTSQHWGGLVGVNAADGELVYATYLKMRTPTDLAWDARRSGIWVLGDTRFADYPLTVDAVDSTFCEPGACEIEGCILITGYRCSFPAESALVRVDVDGQQIAYASYLGGLLSDQTRALYLLPDGRLNVLAFAEPLGSLPAFREFGPRTLTEIDPDLRIARPSPRTADARWTRNAYSASRAPDSDFLFARFYTSEPSPTQPPIIHLTPVCDGVNPLSQQCFSLVALDGFGEGSTSTVQTIPGPRLAALALLAVVTLLMSLTLGRRHIAR